MPSSQSAPPSSVTGGDAWQSAAITLLADWPKARPNEDCPLPELFRHAQQSVPHLTIGHFHDGLRQLYADETIRLHPWTGPLSEIPEPAHALMVGHAVAYYASKKNGD